MRSSSKATAPLSGRVRDTPSRLLHDEVLEPQFRHEARCLLPWYVLIEKVLLVEYHRMGLIDATERTAIAGILDRTSTEDLVADPAANMSDLALGLERQVERHLPARVVRWHVDRSRNDLQACAQLLYGRQTLGDLAGTLLDTAQAALDLAERTADLPMPGYTQYQAAQIITPGYYLTAVAGQILHCAERLLFTYDTNNVSPLGAGAMAGQELEWDRDRMARLVGCAGPVPHALTAVASRGWRVEAAAELSTFAVALGRFVTDLMSWGSSELGFIDLPDELSGISAAMPQKKNFPVLERIRGRAAHAAGAHLDLVIGQRGVPYTNMIEVSKESGGLGNSAAESVTSALRLFTAVLRHVEFRPARMRAACERDFLGGFTLANLLTLRAGVPWRTAQVVAGEYITHALEKGLAPRRTEPALLHEAALRHGHDVDDPAGLLAESFDVDRGLRSKKTPGSAHPDAVRALLREERARTRRLADAWESRRATVRAAAAETDRLVGLTG
ncbi:argininosuccinate lyase [Streptomyces ziwulingensis]|uniref:argininosuccinate lyase n=1 Tax=Streptomyces ziwulingensis TaxID=1045501 RepID=A0ABP9CL66_9ACTN